MCIMCISSYFCLMMLTVGIAGDLRDAEFAPPDMNLAHAYIPYLYARDCIAKMMEDMRKMKKSHVTIVQSIESSYKDVENETQVIG